MRFMQSCQIFQRPSIWEISSLKTWHQLVVETWIFSSHSVPQTCRCQIWHLHPWQVCCLASLFHWNWLLLGLSAHKLVLLAPDRFLGTIFNTAHLFLAHILFSCLKAPRDGLSYFMEVIQPWHTLGYTAQQFHSLGYTWQPRMTLAILPHFPPFHEE